MKKFFVLSLSLVLLALASATLVGCKDDPEPEQLYGVVEKASASAPLYVILEHKTRSEVSTYFSGIGFSQATIDAVFADPGVLAGVIYTWHVYGYFPSDPNHLWGIYEE